MNELENLMARYPALLGCSDDIVSAFNALLRMFKDGGKLMIAGNGGSAADCEHIAGELLKSFKTKRPICSDASDALTEKYGEAGTELARKLEGALPAIPLPSIVSLNTAFANDVDPAVAFAQLTIGLGSKGDVLLAISTSGNAQNVINAVMAANAVGVKTIGLSGASGGKLSGLCDIMIRVPSEETYAIQEYHLPVYHALCAMLESELF